MKNEIIARFLEFHAGGTINCKLILPGLIPTESDASQLTATTNSYALK